MTYSSASAGDIHCTVWLILFRNWLWFRLRFACWFALKIKFNSNSLQNNLMLFKMINFDFLWNNLKDVILNANVCCIWRNYTWNNIYRYSNMNTWMVDSQCCITCTQNDKMNHLNPLLHSGTLVNGNCIDVLFTNCLLQNIAYPFLCWFWHCNSGRILRFFPFWLCWRLIFANIIVCCSFVCGKSGFLFHFCVVQYQY